MEFVYVVPRTALFPECYPHGFLPFRPEHGRSDLGRTDAADLGAVPTASAFESALSREGFFVERAYAERTPTLKQVIPYSIIVCAEPEIRVLLVRRLKTGGESRLHDKYSIGIGGHINPEDLDGAAFAARNPIDAGTRREIAEELAVSGEYDIQRLGLLNDDSNPVGAVHVGVVQVVRVRGSVEIRERNQLEGRLVPSEELSALLAQGANFETWSRLLIPTLGELLPKPIAALS
jgi:predicted NUDIX family phosphoesterase